MNKLLTDEAPPSLAAVQAARVRVQRLARLFDEALRIPGTSIRFGLDALLGLVPVVGDVAGLALSAVILVEALRIGVPRPLLVRMLGIAAADALLGLVPLLGDVADVAFRANRRNARLLLAHLGAEEQRLGGRTLEVRGAKLWWILGLVALVALAVTLATSL